MLLVVQATALALGALPVYLLARKHVGSDRAGLGFALAYLLLPSVQWLTLNEFHPVALATPLLLFAFWFLDEDRLLPFASFALLACACKEEIPLVVAGFGLWYALARRRRLAGGVVIATGLLWAGLAIGVVIPHFNHGASSSFYSRYSEVGGSPRGVLETAVTHPWTLIAKAFGHRGVHYLLDLGLPLALLWAFAPLRTSRGAPGARDQPALGDPDADLDPLPLHGGNHSCARDRERARGCAADDAYGVRGRGVPSQRSPRSSGTTGSARSRSGASCPAERPTRRMPHTSPRTIVPHFARSSSFPTVSSSAPRTRSAPTSRPGAAC